MKQLEITMADGKTYYPKVEKEGFAEVIEAVGDGASGGFTVEHDDGTRTFLPWRHVVAIKYSTKN